MDLKEIRSLTDLQKVVVSWKMIVAAIKLYKAWKLSRAGAPRIGDLCYFTDERDPNTWAVGRLRLRELLEGEVIYRVGHPDLPADLQAYPFRECIPVTENEARKIVQKRTRRERRGK